MARLLSFPTGITQAPSSYVASMANMQQLVSDLDWIPTDIAINVASEGMSAEYPTPLNVASYVLEGGVYVDWCGWPMGYLNLDGTWGDFVSANFIDFLHGIGVSDQYIQGFDTSFTGSVLGGCSGAPWQRMWISSYLFPFADSVMVSPGAIVICAGATNAYGIVGVAPTGGSGWYFYASNGVDECDLANFISYCLIAVEPFTCPGGSGNGVQPNCPSGFTWDGSKCAPNSGSGSTAPPSCPAGTKWNASQSLCVPNSSSGSSSGSGSGTGGITTTEKWLLIGGGVAAAIGLIGVILLNMEG